MIELLGGMLLQIHRPSQSTPTTRLLIKRFLSAGGFVGHF
jgi:hypothetical protein